MENVQRGRGNSLINSVTFSALVAVIVFFIYGVQTDLFTSQAALQTFIKQFGWCAPVIFIVFQIIQVVLPISSSAMGCIGGILIFGSIQGFIYNYIGICIGSIAAFLLARHFGMITSSKNIIDRKIFGKNIDWLTKPSFERIFTIAIFMPVVPADLLCYIAGTTRMKFKNFVFIILLGKPFAIALYSIMIDFIVEKLFSLL